LILEGFEKNKGVLDNKKLFLVCGKSFDKLEFADYIKGLNPVRFGNFRPNPLYEEVLDGVEQFNKSKCDTILAVGGGSAMDVAKSIKHYAKSSVEIIAIPTTSGTGSESTHFAVIYKDGVKQSVADQALLPEIVILEPATLENVPEYTRKTTMLDALCHAIESYWSKKSTDESKKIAIAAIKRILEYKDSYLRNENDGNAGMLKAANLAGQAINVTTTTAGHAMCYKITSLYGFAHGHAAALCLPEVWKINKTEIPGITLEEFIELFRELELEYPVSGSREEDLKLLVASVNPQRLKNNPVKLDEKTIRLMYERIIK
jgi:alcohol dehydrogenase class IV